MVGKQIRTSNAPTPSSPYSQGMRAGDLIFVSGHIATDPKNGQIPESFSDQVKQVLANVKAVLEAEGASMDDVVKSFVVLSDMRNFQEMNEVYSTFFKEPYPARTTISGYLPSARAKVEIDVVVYKPAK